MELTPLQREAITEMIPSFREMGGDMSDPEWDTPNRDQMVRTGEYYLIIAALLEKLIK